MWMGKSSQNVDFMGKLLIWLWKMCLRMMMPHNKWLNDQRKQSRWILRPVWSRPESRWDLGPRWIARHGCVYGSVQCFWDWISRFSIHIYGWLSHFGLIFPSTWFSKRRIMQFHGLHDRFRFICRSDNFECSNLSVGIQRPKPHVTVSGILDGIGQ